MNLSEEIGEYIYRWHNLTGNRPTAIPLTKHERTMLIEEFTAAFGTRTRSAPDCVDSVYGIDVYYTPDAKERREQILHRKDA